MILSGKINLWVYLLLGWSWLYLLKVFLDKGHLVTNKTTHEERRHYQRIPFIAEVIMSQGVHEWSCVLLDISLKGMLVLPPSGIKPDVDSVYAIELVLGEDAIIRMNAKINHVHDEYWGLEWSNIDLEGLTHLRRLLELNMANPEEMHRELADLG